MEPSERCSGKTWKILEKLSSKPRHIPLELQMDTFKRIAPSENWNWNCFGCLQIYDVYIYIYRERERERPLFYWVMVCTSPVDLLDKMLKRSRLLPTWPILAMSEITRRAGRNYHCHGFSWDMELLIVIEYGI